MKEKYVLNARPQALKENIVLWRDYRVTILTNKLFRVEKSGNGKFEDRATQAVLYRDMPTMVFSKKENEDSLEIRTKDITLVLRENFEKSTVTLDAHEYIMSESENLLGTYRTLDGFEGNRCMCEASSNHEGDIIELNNGVCAKNGFAIIDDDSFAFGENGDLEARNGVFDKY